MGSTTFERIAPLAPGTPSLGGGDADIPAGERRHLLEALREGSMGASASLDADVAAAFLPDLQERNLLACEESAVADG